LYQISDYLDQNENNEPDSNPSNSTKNEEILNKNQEKIQKISIQKEKCCIF